MSAAFFDLDRTVLDCNSGTLWLAAEWRGGRLGVRDLAVGLYWLGRYALGHEGLEHALHDAAALYRGLREEQMAADVRAWFEREVVHRIRPGARQAIRHHREAGDTLILATSSSQFAAACAREAYGFDHAISTRIEVVDGVLTGAVDQLALGRHKLTVCEAWARSQGVDLASCAFYTDSFTDVPLLEQVGHPVVVAPDRRLARLARQRGWSVVDWGEAPR